MSMKQAPAENQGGTLSIKQNQKGDTVEIAVLGGSCEATQSDTGTSLGRILIHILTEQLGGRVEYQSGTEKAAVLSFPIRTA